VAPDELLALRAWLGGQAVDEGRARDAIGTATDGLPGPAAARLLLRLAGRHELAAGLTDARLARELAELAEGFREDDPAVLLMHLLDRLRVGLAPRRTLK
jgi:hypothetical protein